MPDEVDGGMGEVAGGAKPEYVGSAGTGGIEDVDCER